MTFLIIVTGVYFFFIPKTIPLLKYKLYYLFELIYLELVYIRGMKNILNSPIWKSVFVIVFMITMILVFRFIENQTIKTLFGMGGFTLMLLSFIRNKKSTI